MKVNISPSNACGTICPPPSKSFAHRLLLGCALSRKNCVVSGIIESQDMLATLDCIKSLGIDFSIQDGKVFFNGESSTISSNFNCRESGSTLRFLIPIAMVHTSSATFYGSQKLISRGVEVYKQLFADKGLTLTTYTDRIEVKGNLKSGLYQLVGNVSSQFITGLMFALPLLEGDSVIKIIPPVESLSYIDITIQSLKTFGIQINKISDLEYRIKGGQKYINVDTIVEGDWSNAAFLYALKYLGHNVNVHGLNFDSVQGDKVCLELLDKIVNNQSEDLQIDLTNCPDLAPVLFAVASMFNGGTFVGTKRLAIKESNRALAMQEELEKFGVKMLVEENLVKIYKSQIISPAKELFGHNDHRIVMALSVLLIKFGGSISDAQAVEKSYPNFFEDLTKLGVKISYEK